MWNTHLTFRQQNWKIKLVILGIFPSPSILMYFPCYVYYENLTDGNFVPIPCSAAGKIILLVCVCSCFNRQKVEVISFMGKNCCYRQTYISIYDFFSFNLWHAYQSNVIYTAVVIFPSSSHKNISKCCFPWTHVKLEQGLQVWHTALLSGEWYHLQNDTIF